LITDRPDTSRVTDPCVQKVPGQDSYVSGSLRIRGKGRDGGKLRELPLTRLELRTALTSWLEQRITWPGAATSPALLLNQRGGRLSDRSGRTIITNLGEQVGLGHDPTDSFGPHVLRH
jgi:integrase/recombinase XerC